MLSVPALLGLVIEKLLICGLCIKGYSAPSALLTYITVPLSLVRTFSCAVQCTDKHLFFPLIPRFHNWLYWSCALLGCSVRKFDLPSAGLHFF